MGKDPRGNGAQTRYGPRERSIPFARSASPRQAYLVFAASSDGWLSNAWYLGVFFWEDQTHNRSHQK